MRNGQSLSNYSWNACGKAIFYKGMEAALQEIVDEHIKRSDALLAHLPPYWRSGPKEGDL